MKTNKLRKNLAQTWKLIRIGLENSWKKLGPSQDSDKGSYHSLVLSSDNKLTSDNKQLSDNIS